MKDLIRYEFKKLLTLDKLIIVLIFILLSVAFTTYSVYTSDYSEAFKEDKVIFERRLENTGRIITEIERRIEERGINAAVKVTSLELTALSKEKAKLEVWTGRDPIPYSKSIYEVVKAGARNNLIFLVIAFVLSDIFSKEHRRNVISLILSSKVDRWRIYLSKLISTLSVSLFIVAVYFMFLGALGAVFFGIGDGNLPVYSLKGYMGSTIVITIKEYIFYEISIFLLLSLLSGIIAMTTSAIYRNHITPIVMVFLVIYIAGSVTSVYDFKEIFITHFRYKERFAGELFGYSLGYSMVNIVFYSCLFALVAYRKFRKKEISC